MDPLGHRGFDLSLRREVSDLLQIEDRVVDDDYEEVDQAEEKELEDTVEEDEEEEDESSQGEEQSGEEDADEEEEDLDESNSSCNSDDDGEISIYVPLAFAGEANDENRSEMVCKKVIDGFSDIAEAAQTKKFDSLPYGLAIEYTFEAFMSFGNEARQITLMRRKEIAKAMVEHGVVEPMSIIFADIISDLLPTRFWKGNNFYRIPFLVARLLCMLFYNYTDEIWLPFSMEVCKNDNIAVSMVTILQELLNDHVEDKTDEKMEGLLDSCLGWAYNLAMHNDSIIIENLQAHNVTDSVRPYIRSPKKVNRIAALLHLIYVENEEDSIELSKNPECIDFLISSLRDALKSGVSPDGYCSKELLKAIEKFAVADVNKAFLRKVGIMDLIKDVLDGDDVNEKNLALKILSQLSFDDENATIIKTDLLGRLNEFSKLKPDKKANKKLSKNAKAVLWMIASTPDSKIVPEDPPPPYSSITPYKESHIMISYSWSDKETVIRIKDFLKENGFKVWIDRENITTEKYDALAAAVENAWLVLIAISRKYKESSDCRKEASYAKELNKEIIPLKMEDFKPDGWLGFFVADLIYQGFKDKYTPEAAGRLLVEVKRIYEKRVQSNSSGLSQVDGLIQPETAKRTFSRKSVKKFSQADAIKFLEDNGVNCAGDKVIDGEHLICLADLRKSDPRSYQKCLKKDFGITSIADMLAIKKVLKQLKK